jgi:hypothetical protein
MSAEKLTEALATKLNRRSFLVKLGVGAAGALLGMLGTSKNASALYHYACCTLCYAPGCAPNQSCYCNWCWDCCFGHQWYSCCECYAPGGGACSGGCSNAICSWVDVGGYC